MTGSSFRRFVSATPAERARRRGHEAIIARRKHSDPLPLEPDVTLTSIIDDNAVWPWLSLATRVV